MMPDRRDADALTELIDRLADATDGDRRLDLQIEYCAGIGVDGHVDAAGLLIEDGFSWDTVSEALDDRVPSYSSSLDAILPGENIVLVIKSRRRRKWGAAHRAESGREYLAWAATEPMARRMACLCARRDRLLEAEGGGGATRTDGETPISEETRDWKVMF